MKEQDKQKGFKTPKGYFEGFTDKLLHNIDKEASSMPKEDGFRVPDNYFEKLSREILQKLDQQETKVKVLHPYRKYYYAAASIAAILVLVITLQFNKGEGITFEDLANSDIESYFDNNELGLTSYELAEVLAINELEISDILETQLNEENIIDYLDDNIDDFEELNLENDELQ